MNEESLLHSFREEMQTASSSSFPTFVDSFANLWDYEFGSLEGLPSDINEIVGHRAVEYDLYE
ncbi:hypothetical protein GJU40_09670 [Bacillus lacus]|uniref:Uncharacterized protein n=1 Tax=Metabacillus lacus TaxID=1983721 RepID=A0A7X2J0C3_9BACI|nr:hypothetical protein [Metabacillus lacus]MRX72418.1 hypothetical protein [Metabacillus lacus]